MRIAPLRSKKPPPIEMCAAFEIHGKIFRPGKPLAIVGGGGKLRAPWAGFARDEIRAWWKRKGWTEVDVPATRFAERSDRSGRLLWEEIPDGMVLRGLCEERNRKWILRLVTRAASAAESCRFEHDRMPVLEPPLFTVRIEARDLPGEDCLLPGFELL